MSGPAHAAVLTVFTLASCIWIGGYVAIAVVARAATRTLNPGQRVDFFRALGRSYLRVGLPALVVALGTGAVLLDGHDWDGPVIAAVVVAACLVLSLVWGVVQARRMTRRRAAALAAPQDSRAAEDVRRGARGATALRAVIGLLSVALVVLGSVLAS